ncbi:hypothetical protein AOQ84DRAFT_74884 [Glonium stellatum]|uniref:Uncharacterized protein n=1 Tax=Glonium stellatum TaxID=574774 RepID=A0A8E2FB65_9PEZI|nr:hypothetical protein AOQ84DRAFT_74884 [Glonium stellatum]
MRFQILSFSSAIFGLLAHRVGASCYYPDGTFPTDYSYEPCTGDQYSSCCIPSEGDQCLSNGLCYYTGGQYAFRGACTDKTWQASQCFQHCKSGDAASSWDELVSCGGTKYCCYSDGETCCNNDANVFEVSSGTVVNDFAMSTAATTGLPIASATDVGAGAQPTSSTYTSHTGTKQSPNPSGSNAAASTATSTAPLPPPPEPAKQTSHVAIIAGAAAAVIIVIIAVGLAWFCARRRYNKRTQAVAAPANSYPMTSDGFQRLPDKSPRPVEVPVPHSTPAPPYQPPTYPTPPGVVEMESPYAPPQHNQWGHPVHEAP